MNRLLRISFNTLLNSLLPILMWVLLGEIVDRSIVNIFTITYSVQFIYTLLVAIFGTGANITTEKEKINDIVDSNILLGIFITFLITLFFSLNINSYINFMNLDPTNYSKYCIYSFGVMFFQTVIRLLCEKLYFKDENKKANKITTLFNIENIIFIILFSLILNSSDLSIALTLILDFFITIYLVITNISKLSFNFKIWKNIKYVSNDIFDSIGMFIIYFIGQRTTFEFGTMYLIAMNFEILITDAQWDMSYSIITSATIDASRDKLNYKESLKNARKLIALLISSTLIMGIVLYSFYKPNLWLLLFFVSVQIIDISLSPRIWIKQQYIQINYSAKKNTFHKNIYEIIRIIFSFVPTPFCTYIGQYLALIYEFIVYNIYYKSKFYIKNGYLKLKKNKECIL